MWLLMNTYLVDIQTSAHLHDRMVVLSQEQVALQSRNRIL